MKTNEAKAKEEPLKRTHRLRRLAAAVALGVGMVGGMVGVAAGTAGAAPPTTATISATSKVLGTFVGTNQAAGTITIKLPASGTGTFKITLTASNTPATGTVVWSSAKVTSTGVLVTPHTVNIAKTTAVITFTVKTKATGTSGTIKVHTIEYTTNAALDKAAKVVVTPTSPGIVFKPLTVSNATYPSPAPTAPKVSLTTSPTRPIPPNGVGATGAVAGTWTLRFFGKTGTGIRAGSHITIAVTPKTQVKNVCTKTQAVAFATTPKVTFVSTTHATAKAKFKVSERGTGTGCSTKFAPNVLEITFTTTVKFNNPKTTGTFVIAITGVKYSNAFTTTPGLVKVTAAFFNTKTAKVPTVVVTRGATEPTNAVISKAYATGTATTMAPGSYDQPIKPITVTESVAGSVPKGYVCVTLMDSTRTSTPATGTFTGLTGATGSRTVPPPATRSTGVYFNTSAKAAVKATSGNGAAGTLAYVTAGNKALTFSFKVTSTSTTASTYTVSTLAVNTNGVRFAQPLITVFYATTATCKSVGVTGIKGPTDHVAVAFMNTQTLTREIYGVTADATAAAEFETAFPAPACPTFTSTFRTTVFYGKTEAPAVLATDKTFPDALSSQYLAGMLTTGTLLTPVTALSQVTINALRVEGINHVYVVGGPLAVSTAVVKALGTMTAYKCGGSKIQTNETGAPLKIKVTRIWGPTQYDTAQQIAQSVAFNRIGFEHVPGAYGGGATGNGAYNDTSGTATAKPVTGNGVRTAIVASGAEFQDAEAASALAYNTGLPVLLTTPTGLSSQAKQAIQTLHIRQVFLMGGTLAINNTVAKAIHALTVTGSPVEVLRIAGKDYTDTAVQLAKMELTQTTTLGIGWFSRGLLVARGNGFSDGIAGAVLEQTAAQPLLLTENPTTVGTYLTTFLKFAGAGYGTPATVFHITHLTVLGGPLAVSPTIITQMQTDLKG